MQELYGIDLAYIGFAISVATLIVLFTSVLLARKHLRDHHRWNRRQSALEYSSLFHDGVKQCRTNLDRYFGIFTRISQIPVHEVEAAIEEETHIRTDINYLLTYYENMAIACSCNVADEQILKEIARGSVIRFYHLFSPYIDARREETKNDCLWENFEALATKWKTKRENFHKKPLLG